MLATYTYICIRCLAYSAFHGVGGGLIPAASQTHFHRKGKGFRYLTTISMLRPVRVRRRKLHHIYRGKVAQETSLQHLPHVGVAI